MLLNNVYESFNNVLMLARDKSILIMMEWIRRYVIRRDNSKKEGLETFQQTIMLNTSK